MKRQAIRQLIVVVCALIFSHTALAQFSFIPSFLGGKGKQQEEKQLRHIQDPSYGAVLYEFFQQNYFQAMTEIMVAEEQQSMPSHQDFANVMMGGIQLSYGMDTEAGKTFNQVIDQHANDNNRARGWFYLGKLAYQKNKPEVALEAFARVDQNLDRPLHDELVYLHEKITADRPLTETAIELGFKVKENRGSIYQYYRDYNRAMTLLASDDSNGTQVASQLLALYAKIKASSDSDNSIELLGLRDKVLNSLGYLYLQMGDNDGAISWFKRVRQDSLLAGKAMVGYGWATINKQDYQASLTPWLALQGRSMAESTTHEALLAVPYIYEAVQLDQQALSAYDLALLKMGDELSALETLAGDIEQEGYLAAFTQSFATFANRSGASQQQQQLYSGAHWLDADASLIEPDALDTSGLRAHLSELLASADMRTLFGQLNDIYWLNHNLDDWQSRLTAFDFMVAERAERSVLVMSGAEQDKLNQRYQDLQQRRDALASAIDYATLDQSSTAVSLLFSEDEIRSAARIEAALARLDSMASRRQAILDSRAELSADASEKLAKSADPAFIAAQRQQLKKMQANLYWQASSNRVARLWEKQKLLNLADDQLQEIQQRQDRIPAIANALTEQTAYTETLAIQQSRLESQQNKLRVLREQLEAEINQRLQLEIVQRKQRLNAYIGQVRLSKASLLERQISEAAL